MGTALMSSELIKTSGLSRFFRLLLSSGPHRDLALHLYLLTALLVELALCLLLLHALAFVYAVGVMPLADKPRCLLRCCHSCDCFDCFVTALLVQPAHLTLSIAKCRACLNMMWSSNGLMTLGCCPVLGDSRPLLKDSGYIKLRALPLGSACGTSAGAADIPPSRAT